MTAYDLMTVVKKACDELYNDGGVMKRMDYEEREQLLGMLVELEGAVGLAVDALLNKRGQA